MLSYKYECKFGRIIKGEDLMKKIGVLTSGGDSPGMNAAIRAVVRAATARGYEVYGIYDGYQGLVENRMVLLNRKSVSDMTSKGGTMLGSARLPEFKEEEVQEKAVQILKSRGIDGLVVIGGDGTYKGAQALSQKGVACMALPGTIDNDIDCTEYTIGFDTALQTIIENVDKLRDTSSSHHRCSVVEVMGRHCGDLALFSGITTGAEIIITPDTGFDLDEIIERLKYYDQVKQKNHAIVIISENLTDVEALAKAISEKTGFSGRATVLGHIQRGGSPTGMDRLLATQMADKAVERISEGYSGECICLQANKIVALGIDEALNMPTRNRLDLVNLHHRLV